MELYKTTSCISTNESYYSTKFVNNIKLIVTKQTTTSKIINYIYMRVDGKCSRIKMNLFPYIKGHKKDIRIK